MLQQTQVATVVPYYRRFLARFPTVADLAGAEEQDVLRLWEGLGYYRRATQLHTAAKQVVAEHGARFPQSIEVARRLPGVGRYTAGAILSLAFDARQPILEANTARLYSRLLAYRGDLGAADGQRALWNAAERILPARGCGEVNQALMELGSQVCTSRAPACQCCPLAALCPTNRMGLHDVIPRSKAKVRIEEVREAAVVVRDGDKVLLVQRTGKGRWAGLWEFPRFPFAARGRRAAQRELSMTVGHLCGLQIVPGGLLMTLRHSVTRFRITLECYESRLAAGGGESGPGRSTESCECPTPFAADSAEKPYAAKRWIRLSELVDYPLSTTARRLAISLSASE